MNKAIIAGIAIVIAIAIGVAASMGFMPPQENEEPGLDSEGSEEPEYEPKQVTITLKEGLGTAASSP